MYIIQIQYITTYYYNYSFHSFKGISYLFRKEFIAERCKVICYYSELIPKNTIRYDILFAQQLLLLRVYSLLTISRQTGLAIELAMAIADDT